VSGVQRTRESLLFQYGTVGGRRVPPRSDLYRVDTVIEKPTPTEAEQRLPIPGIRTGHYLCFFGIHVLTPAVMDILDRRLAESSGTPVTLVDALAELSDRGVVRRVLGLHVFLVVSDRAPDKHLAVDSGPGPEVAGLSASGAVGDREAGAATTGSGRSGRSPARQLWASMSGTVHDFLAANDELRDNPLR